MSWNPKKPEIAAIDLEGDWFIVSDIPEVKSKSKSDVAKESKAADNYDDEMLDDDEVNL